MANLLEIKNLHISFDLEGQIISAVNGVNLEIKQDQVLVLAGESGSGKTITAFSLARILPHLAKINRGSVLFQGKDLLQLDESELVKIRGKKIAYIFQEPASFLNPVITIGQQISEAIMLHQNKTKSQANKEATKLLGLVKIDNPEERLFDYPHNLSGGMNQRVMIAMALACRPKLLIADEPTTSLDVTTEYEILKLLLELKNEFGFAILFITHNLSIAKRIADVIAIMYNGEIVEVGPKNKIFDSPKHKHTKELIFAYERIGRL